MWKAIDISLVRLVVIHESHWPSSARVMPVCLAMDGKAADGNGSSRWNSKPNDDVGAWLAARWDQPVTIRKIVIRRAN